MCCGFLDKPLSVLDAQLGNAEFAVVGSAGVDLEFDRIPCLRIFYMLTL